MADYIARSAQSTVSNGGIAIPGTNLRQELVTSPDVFQWLKEGRIFTTEAGALSTAETITATAIIRQQPDLLIRVPKGVVIIPLMAQVSFATSVGLAQVAVSTCDNDPGTSNVTATTPVNQNTRYGAKVSSVLTYKTATGATGTAPTNVADVFRFASADPDSAAANTNPLTYSPYAGIGAPTLVGDGANVNAFMVYVSTGTSGTCWIVASWAEFTYAEVYGS